MASPKVKSLMQVIRKAELSGEELRELEQIIARMQPVQPEEGRSGQILNSLPPKMPANPDELNRAICLLGNRITSDLKDKARQELMLLLGVYPTLEQASIWKQTLTKKYKESSVTPDLPKVTPSKPPSKLPSQSTRFDQKFDQKFEAKKQKRNKIQARFEHFNQEADFLERIGLGHLAARLEVSEGED